MKQTSQADLFLERCVDGLLATALFVVPFLMGGRQALGQLVLVVLAIGVGSLWCLRQALSRRQGWTWCGAEIVLAGAIGLAGLQLLPLWPSLIRVLSPHVYEILPLWSPGAEPSVRLGVWSCLSLTPVETRGGLILLTAFAILFLVAIQRIRQIEDVERVLRWVALAGLLMAIFGLLQYLAGNGKFFWFYEHPFSDTMKNVKGSFTNRNHFAHFIILALGPLIWWIQTSLLRGSSSRSYRSHESAVLRYADSNVGFLMAALGCCVFAVLMSLSRGGIAVLVLSGAITLWLLYHSSLLNGKTVLGLAGTSLLVLVCLGVYGYHLVSERIDDFQSIQELDALRQRRNLWQADLVAARDFCWTGSGIGSHAQVNAIYLPEDQITQGLQYTHAENGYLQVAMEAGLVGLLLVLMAISLVGYWCFPVLHPDIPRRVLVCYVGIIPSLGASLLHSLVDFVWYVPGCMVVVVLLAACAYRLSQMVRGQERPIRVVPIPRAAWLLAAPAMLLLGWIMVPGLLGAVLAEPSWHRTLVQLRDLDTGSEAECAERRMTIAQEISRVIQWQPDHALAHARLAEIHLEWFCRAQGPGTLDARHVRDAALQSAFSSQAEMEAWLDRAFGPLRQHLGLAREHTRRAVELCPVYGPAYLRLAALTFLDIPKAPDKGHYIQEALVLRPFDGAVLFEVGQEAALVGDSTAAYNFYRRSFQCGSRYQDLLIRLLAGELPARTFLELFPMDLRSLGTLEAQYRQLKQADDVRVLLEFRAQMACQQANNLQGTKALQMWLVAAHAYRELGQLDGCVWCLQQALQWESSNYEVRSLLGTCLFQAKRYAEAEEHVSWCRQCRPNDESLQAMLEKIVSERLRVTRHPASVGHN